MPPSNLSELLQAAAKQEQERVANQIADANEKLISMAYDKAATYTTIIIFGGYAGIFAIWQLTKEYLSKEQALWSALAILASLLTFVLFEIFKMVFTTREFMSKVRVLNLPETRSNPQRLIAALQDLETVQKARLGKFMIVWAITIAICLAGALAATGILAFAFITGLAR